MTLTDEEVREILKRISLRRDLPYGQPPCEASFEYEYKFIKLTIFVPDGLGGPHRMLRSVSLLEDHTEEGVLRTAFEVLRYQMRHEAGECFLVDGVNRFDPHRFEDDRMTLVGDPVKLTDEDWDTLPLADDLDPPPSALRDGDRWLSRDPETHRGWILYQVRGRKLFSHHVIQ